MRRRVKGLVAAAVASAAIVGVLAAPASAARPIHKVTGTCTLESGGLFVGISTNAAGAAQKNVTAQLNANDCEPGTKKITIQRL